MKKECIEQTLRSTLFLSDYNYLITMGWVIILKDNRPVNFMADCGDIECVREYYYVDNVFAEICRLHPENDVVTIIEEFNELRKRLFKAL